MTPKEIGREWQPRRPTHLGSTVAVHRRGGGDPTMAVVGGRWWLARHTPDGPGTLALRQRPDGSVEAQAWGSGAHWLLDGIPELLGDADDDSAFVAHHPQVANAHRAHADWRISRSRQVIQSLVPTVIEQRVTGAEAFASYRRLVQAFGEPAPRPSEAPRLWAPPDAKGWAAIPSWEWLRAGVDAGRADAVMRAAAYAGRLEECVDLPLAQAHSRLRALPGIGVWTAAEVAQRALGDPDAVSFGDYHVARDIGYALTGVETDDAGMERLLEPYRGQRYRVQALLGLAGHRRPRHGARRSLPTHLPRRFR